MQVEIGVRVEIGVKVEIGVTVEIGDMVELGAEVELGIKVAYWHIAILACCYIGVKWRIGAKVEIGVKAELIVHDFVYVKFHKDSKNRYMGWMQESEMAHFLWYGT